MNKIVNFVKGLLTGDSKAGEAVHGVLDLFPVANQVVAKAFSYLFSGDVELAKEEFRKLLTVRNGVALVGSIAYLAGWVTLADVQSVVEYLSQFMLFPFGFLS